MEALKIVGIDAYTTGRNDLLIDGKKISGNAEHVHRNRVLHHGTLLYNSQLDSLKGALKVDLTKFEDKAVQSNRSEVTNIAPYLPVPMEVEDFGCLLFSEIRKQLPLTQIYTLTDADREAIQKLSDEKYRTWDWIFGYSPKYRFTNRFETQNGAILINLLVEKGLMTEVLVSGAISAQLSAQISRALLGCSHDLNVVRPRIAAMEVMLVAGVIEPEMFASAMF